MDSNVILHSETCACWRVVSGSMHSQHAGIFSCSTELPRCQPRWQGKLLMDVSEDKMRQKGGCSHWSGMTGLSLLYPTQVPQLLGSGWMEGRTLLAMETPAEHAFVHCNLREVASLNRWVDGLPTWQGPWNLVHFSYPMKPAQLPTVIRSKDKEQKQERHKSYHGSQCKQPSSHDFKEEAKTKWLHKSTTPFFFKKTP